MGIRKNQNKLTAAEKARFVAALKKMKTDVAAAYNYDKYPTIHNNAFGGSMDVNPAHLGPAFFPWHRYFLRKLERDLQAADVALGHDGAVWLPYWDWTHDNADAPGKQRGSLWQDDMLGGFGAPVTSGPFRDGQWPVVPFPFHPPKLARALGRASIDPAANSSLPTENHVKDALAIEGFDCPPWNRDSPAGPALAAPPAPMLSGAAGGSLPPGIYRVAITYVNARGETRPSQEATICLGGACTPANTNNAISLASPPAATSAAGYNVYVSVAGGAAHTGTQQGATRGMGTAATIGAIAAGAEMPTINSTGSFRNVAEGWTGSGGPPAMHNTVHVWVGGSMGPGSSPNDPVFFMHHCNVDRLWALWQFRHPGQNYPLLVPKTSGPGFRPHGLNDLMPPWTAPPEEVRPRDMLNHTALGYTYDTDPVGMSINVAP